MRDLIPVLLLLSACLDRGDLRVPGSSPVDLRPSADDTDDTVSDSDEPVVIDTGVDLPSDDTDVGVDTGEGLPWPEPVIVSGHSVLCEQGEEFAEWSLSAAVPVVPRVIELRGYIEVQLFAWTVLPRGCAAPVLGGEAIGGGFGPTTRANVTFATLAGCDSELELAWVVVPEDGLPHVYASTTDLAVLPAACQE